MTQDSSVFNFFPGGAPARGLDALAYRYRELVPHVRLAGPTSFAPAIYQAMKIVIETGGQYHILVIVADGQVRFKSASATQRCSGVHHEASLTVFPPKCNCVPTIIRR